MWLLLLGTSAWAAPSCRFPTPAPAPAAVARDMGACATQGAAHEAVTGRLREKFTLTMEPSEMRVRFDCDDLGPTVSRVVVETGSGHGFNLSLYELTWRDGGYDVLGVRLEREYATYDLYTYEVAARGEVETVHGRLDGSVVTPLLPTVRALLTSQVEEVRLPNPGGGLGMRGSSSSADVLARVAVTDSDGRSLERRFVGYLGSSNQEQHLAPRMAVGKLIPLLLPLPGRKAVDPADRAAFARLLAEWAPHADAPFNWWVSERYLAMAARVGSPEVGSTLLQRLRTLQPAPDDTSERDEMGMRDGGDDRQRVLAVQALATITGLDLRHDAQGAPRKIDEAAEDYLEACTVGAP